MTAIALIRQDIPVTDPSPLTSVATLPRITAAVRDARMWLEKLLADWGVDPEVVYDAKLALTEVFANSIVHAAGESDATITAAMWDGRLRITVSDPDPVVYAPNDDDEEHGRGLAIVKELSESFGTTPMPGGKIVFFVLAVGGAK